MSRLSRSLSLASLSSLALLASLSAASCSKSRDTAAAAPPSPSAVGGGPIEQAENDHALLPGATCEFPKRLDQDHVVRAGCVVDVTKNVLIENGHTLTIERGATLRFHEGAYLEVGHRGSRLVAVGTKDEPIVFTSAKEKNAKAAGDWVGIVFDDNIAEGGSKIDWAIVEYAGNESHGGEGAITVFGEFPPGRVSIDHTTFRNDAQAAVTDRHGRARFGSFSGNVFEASNARALKVDADVFAAIGDDNRFDSKVELIGGVVTREGKFRNTKGDILVTGPIAVDGKDSAPAQLTIEPNTRLAFAKDTWIEVGTRGPAALDAVNVTFTSAEKAPAPGDWVGLLFGEHAQHSRVADSIVEFAGGQEHAGDGAITFVGKKPWQGLDVGLYFITFRNDAQAMISDNGDGCDKGLDPRNGNIFASNGEPCR